MTACPDRSVVAPQRPRHAVTDPLAYVMRPAHDTLNRSKSVTALLGKATAVTCDANASVGCRWTEVRAEAPARGYPARTGTSNQPAA